MRQLLSSVLVVVAVLILCHVQPASTWYCSFSHPDCIDGLAQSSSFFNIHRIASSSIGFGYGYDAGPSPEDDSPSIKIGYWLQYDPDNLKTHIDGSACLNRTTEVSLRVANAHQSRDTPHEHHHKCQNIWGPGDQCVQSVRTFIQFAIYKLSKSGRYYESPLETVLEQIANPAVVPFIPGCPPAIFQRDSIPAYSFINETSYNGQFSEISVAEPGNALCPWRTWYISNTTAQQQAMQWVVGIVTRAPPFGSEPLLRPQDVDVELVCAKAPKNFHPVGDGFGHNNNRDDDDDDDDDEDQYGPYSQEPYFDGDYGDDPYDLGSIFEPHPDISHLSSFLGGRADIVDAFDLDADYDYDEEEEEEEETEVVDSDCSSPRDT